MHVAHGYLETMTSSEGRQLKVNSDVRSMFNKIILIVNQYIFITVD